MKTLVKERPILFSGPMVRAELEDRKSQTRREIVRLAGTGPITEFGKTTTPGFDWHFRDKKMRWHDITHAQLLERCPYGQPGDRLWVRETFVLEDGGDEYLTPIPTDGSSSLDHLGPDNEVENREVAHYFATEPDCKIISWDCLNGDCGHDDSIDCSEKTKWKPSIHMPRWASRIDLEVVKVRVERLQDISEEDAKAEGAPLWPSTNFEGPHPVKLMNHKNGFFILWEKINGLKSWNANPWVWVIDFRVVRPIKGHPDAK